MVGDPPTQKASHDHTHPGDAQGERRGASRKMVGLHEIGRQVTKHARIDHLLEGVRYQHIST